MAPTCPAGGSANPIFLRRLGGGFISLRMALTISWIVLRESPDVFSSSFILAANSMFAAPFAQADKGAHHKNAHFYCLIRVEHSCCHDSRPCFAKSVWKRAPAAALLL